MPGADQSTGRVPTVIPDPVFPLIATTSFRRSV